MNPSPGDDHFVAAAPPPAPLATSTPVRRHPGWPTLVAAAVGIVLIGATFWWWNRPDALPVSAPPPGGGTLTVPSVLGDVPKVTRPMDATWVLRTLPSYDVDDVLFQYYLSPTYGLVSVVALRGPVEDLPDRAGSTGPIDEWVVIGDVQCSPFYLKVGDRSTRDSGSVCWRSSGDFSLSILTTKQDVGTTAALVDEMWGLQ